MQLFNELFVNLCILGMLLFTMSLFSGNRTGFMSPDKSNSRKLQFGATLGFSGIMLMYHTIPFNGTILDLRQIPVIVAAIYGGWLPSLIAALLIAGARVIFFGINTASMLSSFLIVVIGISCGAISYIKMSVRKKWIFMTISNLVLTSIVFRVLITDMKILLNVYVGYWSISVLGGFIIYCVMEYLRQSKEALQTAQENAVIDYLTGVNNVRKFDEALKETFMIADKQLEKVSLIMFDIDNFKNINDSFGHPSGDEVLRQVTKIVRDVCRPDDIVSRNGGEEFSVILPSCTNVRAQEVAERIRSAVARHDFVLPDRSTVKLTVSLGVSTYRETTYNRECLIHQADEGLYQAKQAGRNRVIALG